MTRSGARDVALLATCQALFLTSMSAVVAAAALIGHQLADTKVLATLPIGIQFVMTMVATVPASLLMKRIGRRDGFTVGASIGLAGALLGFWAIMEASFTLFCVGLALIGAANGFAQYYRFAAADAASEAFRSRAISLVLAGGVIASIGPLLADWSKDLFAPIAFAGVFATMAALYVATLVVLRFITIPPPDEEERSSSGRPLLTIMRQPTFIIAVLGSLVGYAMMSLLMTATPLAMKYCGFGFSDSAQTIQWHVLGMFAPAFVTGHLIKRFGTKTIMACGALLIGLCAASNLHGVALLNFHVALVLAGRRLEFPLHRRHDAHHRDSQPGGEGEDASGPRLHRVHRRCGGGVALRCIARGRGLADDELRGAAVPRRGADRARLARAQRAKGHRFVGSRVDTSGRRVRAIPLHTESP